MICWSRQELDTELPPPCSVGACYSGLKLWTVVDTTDHSLPEHCWVEDLSVKRRLSFIPGLSRYRHICKWTNSGNLSPFSPSHLTWIFPPSPCPSCVLWIPWEHWGSLANISQKEGASLWKPVSTMGATLFLSVYKPGGQGCSPATFAWEKACVSLGVPVDVKRGDISRNMIGCLSSLHLYSVPWVDSREGTVVPVSCFSVTSHGAHAVCVLISFSARLDTSDSSNPVRSLFQILINL